MPAASASAKPQTPHIYVGRFAPTPSGPLHQGSLVAALASWLDARAHAGRWLVRIEDVDQARCPAGMGEHILVQLAACGLVPEEKPWWQTQRTAAYARALGHLRAGGRAYACICTRSQIDLALSQAGLEHQRHGERVYPGTCRNRGLAKQGAGFSQLAQDQGPQAMAWRMNTLGLGRGYLIHWEDRRLGAQSQQVDAAVGDFVLGRTSADGSFQANYQLAVVVDDAAQGITHVVRGEDLQDNTARQILLQQHLGLPSPRYLHTPLVLAADGQKLSKQNGAAPLQLGTPAQVLMQLRQAAATLGLPAQCTAELKAIPLADWLAQAVQAWAGIIAGFPNPAALQNTRTSST